MPGRMDAWGNVRAHFLTVGRFKMRKCRPGGLPACAESDYLNIFEDGTEERLCAFSAYTESSFAQGNGTRHMSAGSAAD